MDAVLHPFLRTVNMYARLIPMLNLTPRQRDVLSFLKSYTKDNGLPPTRSEIADHFGWESQTAAQDHLIQLKIKGYINLLERRARGIIVL